MVRELSCDAYSTHSSVLSLSHRYTAITTTKANTAAVVCIVSLRVGQTTFFTSASASRENPRNCWPGALIQATYLGGSGGEAAYAIAVDAAGDAYVTGYTA